MPKIHKLGDLAEVKDRWPHNVEFKCFNCHTTFGLTPEDSKDGYYKVSQEEIDEGDQRESYFVNRFFISFNCPVCGFAKEETSPKGWTVAFAKGTSNKQPEQKTTHGSQLDEEHGRNWPY